MDSSVLSMNFALGPLDMLGSTAEIGPVSGSGGHQDPPAKRHRRALNAAEEQTEGFFSIESSIEIETSTEAAIEATERPTHQLDDLA